MKILVTGAAGYIGSVLVPALLKRGYEVVALDNFMYNQTPLLDCCHDENLTIVRGDVRAEWLMSMWMKRVDAIFPLACITGAPAVNRDLFGARSVNFEAIRMMLRLRKDQIIIFPTTNSGYGIGQKGIYCTEETRLSPISYYAELKIDAEKLILGAGNSITLRLATTFGISPRMRLDLLVNDFTYRAVIDGFVVLFEPLFKRNFIHVRDVAGAFIHCLENFGKMKNEPYNVGLNNANLNKWELCGEIKKQVPKFYFTEAAVGEDPDKRDYIVSNDKIRAKGFEPTTPLQAGIAELVKGYNVIGKGQHRNS